jgi:hypothetical protein
LNKIIIRKEEQYLGCHPAGIFAVVEKDLACRRKDSYRITYERKFVVSKQ